MTTTTHSPRFETEAINVIELRELQNENPNLRLVDVRTGGEFETVHIPGSYSIPLDTLGEHVEDLAAVDPAVVLVCQSGARASQAHGKLKDAGKQNLHILEGGIASWQAAGGDVAQGPAERWAMDRQVRGVAGTLVVIAMALSTKVPGAKWIAGGVGAGLSYSAASNTCAMAAVLSKLPYNKTRDCDIAGILEDLDRTAS